MVAAGDGIIGEHHMIKWPIARILILPRDRTWSSDYEGTLPSVSSKTYHASSNLNNKSKKSAPPKAEVKGEILIRYQHTPALGSSRSLLVFTQPRTRGMCSVLDFWPTENSITDNRDGMNKEGGQSTSLSPDLAWFEPL